MNEIIPAGALEAALLEPLGDTATLQLPDPDMLSYYRQYTERRLWLDFEVDDEALVVARNILIWNIQDDDTPPDKRKPIWLYLFNYGGSADLMWMLIDTIKTSDTPVYTVNMGKCDSAAALIFMAGDKRFMMPSATVTIHEGSNQLGGDAVKVLDQAESYKAMIKRMRDYIISVTKIPPQMLCKKKNNDWELNSATCMKYNVCDHVIDTLSDVI